MQRYEYKKPSITEGFLYKEIFIALKATDITTI